MRRLASFLSIVMLTGPRALFAEILQGCISPHTPVLANIVNFIDGPVKVTSDINAT